MLDFGFLLSVALAHVTTNLDNLAMLLVLSYSVGRQKALAGFLLAQAIVIGLAMALGSGAEALVGIHSRWLGLVPIAFGIMAFRRQEKTQTTLSGSKGALAVTALFLGLSFDTLAVLTPIFADSMLRFDLDALTGASLSSLAIGGSVYALTRAPRRSLPAIDRLNRIAPFVMIAAGIYVLMNTGTDLQ